MIEVRETYTHFGEDRPGAFRKVLIIILDKEFHFPDPCSILVLGSRRSYTYPLSHKRWKLIEKFKKEGCTLRRSCVVFNPHVYRRKLWMSLEELVEIGHIYDSDIVKDLKKVDIHINLKKKRAKEDVKI